MKVIPADYNAVTEEGHLRLGFIDSRAALLREGHRAGDRVWLSDGEVLVGATLADDGRYGLVGIPDWATMVHLDDDEAREAVRRRGEPVAAFDRDHSGGDRSGDHGRA